MFGKKKQDRLPALLASLNPDAPLAERNLWIIEVADWIRGEQVSVDAAVARVGQLLDAMEAKPELRHKLQAWWACLLQTVDLTALLADFGFAPRTAFFNELAERLRWKLLPSTPETIDATVLFSMALHTPFDAQWLKALDAKTLERIAALLSPGFAAIETPVVVPTQIAQSDVHEGVIAGQEHYGNRLSPWQMLVLNAVTYCAGQILASGFTPELRLRMSGSAQNTQPFYTLISHVEELRKAMLHHSPKAADVLEAEVSVRSSLDECRAAVASIYEHFEDNGVSVGVVFRLRQLRMRILRVRELLDCLLSANPNTITAKLLAHLVVVGLERQSVRALISSNSSLLASKVAERSAETGEHYITRDSREYAHMVRKAAGGGFVMAFTTLIKFALHAVALSAFWGGFIAGINYAISFVLIQLLHFTVATKQPAMTAPAMAAKLKESGNTDAGIASFVDEVSYLVRSQVAAVLGNVLVVFPTVLVLALAWAYAHGTPFIDKIYAMQTLHSISLLGPSVLYAAFTGVLLFSSSIIAGWTENWFVLHHMDSAIRYNPRITGLLGKARAARWARFMRRNISGFASNISLGFMLGLIPVTAQFFGLPIDIRHVTLASGQAAAAAASMGLQALHYPGFWLAIAALPFMGGFNILVSFYLAFRLALRAQNVSNVERSHIYKALTKRFFSRPMSFLLPLRLSKSATTEPVGGR
ncbi:site-specific recombinase [Comamonas odontotermitis]|uniref:Site-specific recombinase n=1 Tax=Comamonas odontotermitis TaxID=379895 RepID=A0ABR6RBY1_9BURK|nr:site-specific recombinase [Comamonas odontotermitis]MBB6576661.1 site-specific recombinase [Comamonas odontotermitis]